MSDIYEEIKQDVQVEKLLQFWKKYQKKISSVLTGALVAIVITYYWQYRQDEIRTEASHDYSKAMMYVQAKMDKKALESLELMAHNSDNSYTDLAKFFASGIFVRQDNLEDAHTAYVALIKETSTPEFKDLAQIKLGYLDLDMGKPQEIIASMKRFLVDGNPWKFHALEITALAQLRLDELRDARENLEKIVGSEAASPTLKARADLLLGRTLVQ